MRLNYYPPSDLEQIVHRTAEVMQVDIDEDGAKEIAKRSRRIRASPIACCDASQIHRQVQAEQEHAHRKVAINALQLLEVDQFGLDDMDSRILKAIIEKFEGGPVGVGTIAAAVGEDVGTLEEVYEPFLVQNGFLQRTPRGRVATAQAYRHFGFNPPPTVPGQPTLF